VTFARYRRAFTLIEVLVAMVVLATISVGLLATTWALVRFANGEAEQLVADAYCHDVLWAIYSQNYGQMLDGQTEVSWEIDPVKHLPRVESVDLFGQEKTTYPLWRSQDASRYPTCVARVTENAVASNKTIVVEVRWHDGNGWQSHSNMVVRSCIERQVR